MKKSKLKPPPKKKSKPYTFMVKNTGSLPTPLRLGSGELDTDQLLLDADVDNMNRVFKNEKKYRPLKPEDMVRFNHVSLGLVDKRSLLKNNKLKRLTAAEKKKLEHIERHLDKKL